MSVAAFLSATAALVGLGVALRRLLPRDGSAADSFAAPAPQGAAE